MNYICILILGLLLLPGGVFSQSKPVEVQTPELAMSVSPAILEVILDKYEPVTKEVIVMNTSPSPLLIKTLRQSFTPEEKREIPKNLLHKYDASTWIELDEGDRDFILQPKEARKVKVRLRQPRDASPGGHYASLIFQPLIPETSISQDSVFVYGRIVTLLFMQVRGDIVEDVTLDEMNIARIYETRPKMSIRLHNRGNTHVRPSGNITVIDSKGKPIKTLTFLPSLLLPGAAKDYEVEWKDQDLPIGFFSAVAHVQYGEDLSIKSREKDFIILPFLRIVFILSITGMGGFLLIKIRKRLVKAALILFYGEHRTTRVRRYKPFIDKRIKRS